MNGVWWKSYHALLLTDLLTTDCTPGFHIDANVSTDITILIIITKTWIDKYRYHKNHHQSNFCDIHFCEFAFPEKHANFIFENWQFLGLFQFFSGYELKLCNFLHRAKSSGVRLHHPIRVTLWFGFEKWRFWKNEQLF